MTTRVAFFNNEKGSLNYKKIKYQRMLEVRTGACTALKTVYVIVHTNETK